MNDGIHRVENDGAYSLNKKLNKKMGDVVDTNHI
jgi:hypothetical protein